MLSSGIIADKLLARGLSPIASRKWPICIGLVFAALFTIPAAYTPSTAMAVVYISLAMYFINLASGGSWALVSVAAPRRLVASLGSMQNFGGYLGGSAAPLITGIVVDTTHSFVNALLISAAISFAGALVYLFVIRDPDRRSGRERRTELTWARRCCWRATGARPICARGRWTPLARCWRRRISRSV